MKMPSLGYSSPRKVRGLDRQGFEEVLVQNVQELEGFNPVTQIVVVANIGLKKKMEILEVCQEKQYKVSNVKDVAGFIAGTKKKMEDKKKKKKADEEKKKKEQEKKLKKAEEKKKKEEEKKETEETLEEETKKGQKSDKIKILEKRE